VIRLIKNFFFLIFEFIYKCKKTLYKRFGALRIRIKLIIVTGLLFIGLTSILSFILLQNGKKILSANLSETCRMSLLHTSAAIKDDLLAYYRYRSDVNNGSLPLGHIRETILNVFRENIRGIKYAAVVDRQGIIIAHTQAEKNNMKISPADSLFFAGLEKTFERERSDVVEYIHPLFSRLESSTNGKVYLGSTILGFSKKEILQPIHSTSTTIISATVSVIILSVIIIFFIAHRMTGQIDALSEGVKKVGRGNLNVQIPVMSSDELGALAKEFNSMIVHLREKLQMQKFVSKLTVQMIRKRSSSAELPPVGERRRVTLLFSDVRNFSTLTETLSPEEIVRLINVYLDLQARIIEEHGGIVDKFMGDQIMAIFLGETMADDAIHAAVAIQRSIRELNKRRKREGEVVLTLGCGINTGSAVIGNMGSKNRLDYTVIGDVVNLASRLCAIARPGQIIAPIDTMTSLNEEYPTIRLNPVTVKGRTQAVDIFEVDYDRAIIM
jgi:class 3 adenylate cyclase